MAQTKDSHDSCRGAARAGGVEDGLHGEGVAGADEQQGGGDAVRGQAEEPGDGLAVVVHLGAVAFGVGRLVGFEIEEVGRRGPSVRAAFEVQAVDLSGQPSAVEDGLEGLFAQQVHVSGGFFQKGVAAGILQETGGEPGGGRIDPERALRSGGRAEGEGSEYDGTGPG